MNSTHTESLKERKPIIISGPCSAETEEQTLETCLALAKTGRVNMIRAGIWKPRTKPGMFEGIGTKGLPWLKKVKDLTGLPVAVEVATERHVEDCLTFEIDAVWLGARTTVNPFSVQEVADALKGVNIPVMIKNPINPDIELWSGAIERISKAGITNITLVHRGFSSYGNMDYRNVPMWHLPLELKRRRPDIKMICDPSHIGGRRDVLLDISQKAIDLEFDGLMIESHIDPGKAWSDAAQQVTPDRLLELLNAIVWERNSSDAEMMPLEKLRDQINHIDDEIMLLLSRRMNLADKIGLYKKENHMRILQSHRWQQVLDWAITKGESLGLSKDFVLNYYGVIHTESMSRQQRIVE